MNNMRGKKHEKRKTAKQQSNKNNEKQDATKTKAKATKTTRIRTQLACSFAFFHLVFIFPFCFLYIFFGFCFFHLFFVCILFFANFKILRASLGPAMLRVSHPRANLEETATLLWRLEAKHVEGAGGSQPGAGFIEGKGHSNLASTPCVRLPKREPSQRSRPSLMRPSKR